MGDDYMYYIGADLGTSAMKLILMDESGEIARTVSKEYPNTFPKPGWSEQNPTDWYAACVSGVRELVEGIDAGEVAGLSVAGQMHGLVALDSSDDVIRPAILWNDGRSSAEVSYLNEDIGRERLTSLTGNIAFAGFTAPKILWMQKNETELFSKIKKIMLPKDYLVYRLTGDNAAAAIGMGITGEGACNISLGTSGTLFISRDRFSVDEKNALHSFAHADGRFHLMGCMLSAASCNKWWMDQIFGTLDYKNEQAAISDDMLGQNRVLFLPYLMGERSPHNNPDARAVFIGMSMDSTRADMTQAVLEGVCFGIRDSFEVARSQGIKIESTKICGGGAKSPLWKKMIANILNLKVDVIESEEGPAMGGAMLAAVACGEYASVEEIAAKVVKIVDTVEPDPELVAKYEERYQQFKEIYPACKPVFEIITK